MAGQKSNRGEPCHWQECSLAVRTSPYFARGGGVLGARSFSHRLRGGKKSETQRQSMLSFPIGQKAEMADLDEPAWEHVQQEAAHKLYRIQCHDFLLVAVRRITPAKSYAPIFEMKKPAISDRYAMCVVSQIPNHVHRPGKGLLGVDDPVFVFEQPGELIEGFAHLKRGHGSAELQLASAKCTAQEREKFSSELSS